MQLLFTPSYSVGVIRDLVDDIREDDFDVDKGGQVEIIGWLYQYYNIELHDKVVNINGGPIKTNDIPAATQLFTTDWGCLVHGWQFTQAAYTLNIFLTRPLRKL